jgi:hypothetical protein
MVLLWTAVSYLPAGNIPKGIPRRLFTPNPWSHGAYENWTVIKALLLNNPKIFNAYFHFIYKKIPCFHCFMYKYLKIGNKVKTR